MSINIDLLYPPKEVDAWPGYLFYASGRVTRDDKPVRIHSHPKGDYVWLKNDAIKNLGGKRFLLAEVICEAFLGPKPAGSRLIRKDGNIKNNMATNVYFDKGPSIPFGSIRRTIRGEPDSTGEVFTSIHEAAKDIRHSIKNARDIEIEIGNAVDNSNCFGFAFGFKWMANNRRPTRTWVDLPFDEAKETWVKVDSSILLEVSEHGRLRKKDTKRIIHCPFNFPLATDADKAFSYRMRSSVVGSVKRPTRSVAELVAEAFLPHSTGKLTHKDNNHRNDAASNLEFVDN